MSFAELRKRHVDAENVIIPPRRRQWVRNGNIEWRWCAIEMCAYIVYSLRFIIYTYSVEANGKVAFVRCHSFKCDAWVVWCGWRRRNPKKLRAPDVPGCPPLLAHCILCINTTRVIIITNKSGKAHDTISHKRWARTAAATTAVTKW